MKNLLLLVGAAALFSACRQTEAPTTVARTFVRQLVSGNPSEAAALATADSRSTVNAAKPTTITEENISETLHLAGLKESVSGNTARVGNDLFELQLQKEEGEWKVVADERTVAFLTQYKEAQTALKDKWEVLLKEYEARLRIARDYLRYKRERGPLSPQAERLNSVVETLTPRTAWDREKILLYVQKQRALGEFIDKALEPTYAAGADLSMNYFIQLSQASDRVEFAEAAYQQAAQNTPSIVYPKLPQRTPDTAGAATE